ncbi:uncharacterized protein HaLaN_07204, partial [Haematococcus lacustris]
LLTRSAPQSLLISRTRPGLRWRLLEWVRDCFLHLKEAALGSELLWDNVQVAYSLSCVIHHVAGPLSAALNQPLAAVKDLPRVEPDQLEPLRQELLVAAAYLDLAARRARAALLVVGA